MLALDLGERRIGVARSDSGRRIATPHSVLERAGDRGADHRRIADLVDELGATEVVVGLPRSLDGTLGPAARQVLAEVAQLQEALPVTVSTFDERLSTVEARRRRRLADEGPPRAMPPEAGGRHRPAGARRRGRAAVDAAAAAVILQARLDAGDAAGSAPDGGAGAQPRTGAAGSAPGAGPGRPGRPVEDEREA